MGTTMESSNDTMPVAIIGMGCRFPGGVTDPEKLWKLCTDMRSAWSTVPKDRFNPTGFYHPDSEVTGTFPAKGAHFIHDVSSFDASFFNLSTEVAATMDPQIRMQLETTYEAFQSAGLSIPAVAGSNTSVFAGVFARDYFEGLLKDADQLPRSTLTANGSAMMSNRISHFYDLRGPSLTVDTACSTGMTTLHLACQSLKQKESKMAVVSTANLLLGPEMFIALSNIGVLSKEGKCYSWDDRASGYGRGEGIATLILKPLHDAIADGDPIRAVIRQTAINQDGRTQTITSPSFQAQQELMKSCYEKAGLDPADTTFVEAHMTGTLAGDPVEAEAIGSVFSRGRSRGEPLFVGSIKPNIGHSEASSGLASVIRVVLALEHKLIPPNIHFDKPNPQIDLECWGMEIPRAAQQWPPHRKVRASINNFGYGGSNSHAIIDAADEYLALQERGIQTSPDGNALAEKDTDNRRWLFPISAKEPSSLSDLTASMLAYLEQHERDNSIALGNIAYTLIRRFSSFAYTTAIHASSLLEFKDALKSKTTLAAQKPSSCRIGFVFNGQGAQWHAMGRELLNAYPVYQHAVVEADRLFTSMGSSWSLLDELGRDSVTSRLVDWELSLPVCVALQLCLVRLLHSWSVYPSAITSHSSGEYAAAFAAGVLSFEQALRAVFLRVMVGTTHVKNFGLQGGMLAVGLGQEKAQSYVDRVISGELVVACVNSPSSVTLSGDSAAIEEIEQMLQTEMIFTRRLRVPAAYHSHHMLPMASDYQRCLEDLGEVGDFGSVRYYSPVTGGRIISGRQLGPEHWVRNSTQPVLFMQALQVMCSDLPSAADQPSRSVDMIIEVGPHGALAGPIRETISDLGSFGQDVAYGSCLIRNQNAVSTMHDLACNLLRNGCKLDLQAVNFPYGVEGMSILHSLPTYAWNHSKAYWKEPRLHREYRQRSRPQSALLGPRTTGLHPSVPTWRTFVSTENMPWLADHRVQNQIVYPAAGYICMVVEALGEIHQGLLAGYQFQDIHFENVLAIPETGENIEVHLSVESHDARVLQLHQWQHFSIQSCRTPEGTWTEHCHGFVSGSSSTDVSDETRSSDAVQLQCTPDEQGYIQSKDRMDPSQLYAQLRAAGVQHGPRFQNMSNIVISEDISMAVFAVDNVSAMDFDRSQKPPKVHPTTIDSVLQAAYPILPQTNEKVLTLPRSIEQLFISAEISNEPGHEFESISRLSSKNKQGFTCSLTTKDKLSNNTTPVVAVDGLFLQAVAAKNVNGRVTGHSDLCYTMKWVPDISMANELDMKRLLSFKSEESEQRSRETVVCAALQIIDETLAALTPDDIEQMDWQHQRLLQWMTRQAEKASKTRTVSQCTCSVCSGEDNQYLHTEEAADKSVEGKLVRQMGKALLDILRKKTSALEVMMQDNLLQDYYSKSLRYKRSYKQVSMLMKMLAEKHPKAKLLEIGAGTGGCTKAVFEGLHQANIIGGTPYSHFDYTDVSSGFFEGAQRDFGDRGDAISYRTLDIEQDPETQGFDVQSYDVVVASGVLHATKNLNDTLQNVRKLLKPGGRLILVEIVHDTIELPMIFGTLPGWWLSEEVERQDGPNISARAWDCVLQEAGFSGLDVEVGDCEEENATVSVMLSTALEEGCSSTQLSLIRSPTSAISSSSLMAFAQQLEIGTGLSTELGDFKAASCLHGVCIVLDDGQKSLLEDISSDDFDKIKHLLTNAKGVIWVMDSHPGFALASGLLRTLRLENQGKHYLSLALDRANGWEEVIEQRSQAVTRIIKSALAQRRDVKALDVEFAEQNGQICIQRVGKIPEEQSTALAKWSSLSTASTLNQDLINQDTYVDIETPGLLDTLHFTTDASLQRELPHDYVQVRAEAFGMNFRDVMVAMGQIDDGRRLGLECSGVVTQICQTSSHPHVQVGDRVCVIGGHWSTSVRVASTHVAVIPKTMTIEEAASIPTVFLTAFHAFYHIAHLRRGETVLIHAGAGGVGQAAIMLAQHIGAEIYATAGSEEKRQFIHRKYGISYDHIFSSRDASFVRGVMAMTGQKGVDVVLNSLSGPLLSASWTCIARFGRFVEIGKRDIYSDSFLDMEPMRRAATFAALDLVQVAEHRGDIICENLREIMQLMERGNIRPVDPVRVFPAGDMEKAFREMQMGKHIGKLVIKPHAGDEVKLKKSSPGPLFSPNFSYLVVGSVDGIGRSIAEWTIQNGAKHVIFLSRSAESSAAVQALSGDKVCIYARNCDVANHDGLARALHDLSEIAPPIRGVFQGAMALQDSIFENMSHTAWSTTLAAKTVGTRNLHDLLPRNLHFFIMLSSLLGVTGNPGQANYTAAGAFQDAFARYRIDLGLPAVSIDLGAIADVGYVAQREEVAERLRKAGHREMSIEHVMRVIELAVRHPQGVDGQGQLLTGVFPFVEGDEVAWQDDVRFAPLRITDSTTSVAGQGQQTAGDTLQIMVERARSKAELVEVYSKAILGKVAAIFGSAAGELSVSSSLAQLGVDSLVAVELRNWLLTAVHVEVSVADIMQSAIVGTFAEVVAERTGGSSPRL